MKCSNSFKKWLFVFVTGCFSISLVSACSDCITCFNNYKDQINNVCPWEPDPAACNAAAAEALDICISQAECQQP